MAKALNIKANFQLDTSAARQQLMGLQRELTSVTKGATMNLGVTEQITEAVRAAQLLKQTLSEATDFKTGAFDLSKFSAAIKQQNMEISDFKRNLQTLGPEGEKAFNNLATTIASAQVPLKRTSSGMTELMNTFSNTLRWQATSMAIHKVVGTISEAYSYAQNLDKSLTNIRIVTGHNTEYMKNFAVQANKAAQALSASTLEYTNASLIYYQQGLSDKEVSKRAETTLKLAKVTGESASKVSQQMTAVWNNFSNGVDNLERYADVMTALGATTASSSSEISKGLEKFASVTKTIGLSYDYAASALATVTAQTRQSADSVGTAFKTLFSRLESLNLGETLEDDVTLNKYSEALLKVGVNVMDVNGNLKNMDTILDELGGRWDSLNKAQQVALAQTVGGVRNYTSLITLMDNWEDFQTNLTTAQLAEGTLQKQADIYAESWEAAQQRVKTSAQGIYDTLISSDFFKGFNNVLAGTLNQISEIGRTLGTGGSLAGLTSLFLGLRSDQVASKITDIGVNLLGQTNLGKTIFTAQKEQMINDLNKEVTATASRSTGQRAEILKQLSGEVTKYSEDTSAMTRAQAQANQNFINQRAIQAQTVMNSIVDAEQKQNEGFRFNRQLGETLIGQYKMNNAASAIDQYFRGQLSTANGETFTPGMRQFLANTFEKDLYDLTEGNLSGEYRTVVEERLKATANNILQNDKLGNIIGNNGTLNTALRDILEGNYTGALGGFSIYGQNVKELQANVTNAALDKYYTANPQYVKENGERVQTPESNAIRQAIESGFAKADETNLPTLDAERRTSQFKNSSLGQILEKQNANQLTIGQSIVATGQMLSSVSMATNSIKNFSESVKQGNASFTGLASTLGSVGIASSQVLGVLSNKEVISGLEKFNMTTSKLGAWGLGIAAAGAIAFGAYKVYKTNTTDAKAERANEYKIAATAQAKEDKEKYDAFQDVIAQQTESYGKIFQLQQGTAAYTSQLISANQQARSIIETYGLKAGEDYNIDARTGAISFSAQQVHAIDERLLQTSLDSENRAQLATSAYTQLALRNRQEELKTERDSLYDQTGYAYRDPEEIKKRDAEIKEELDSITLQQQADYQAALASTLASQGDKVTDAMKLATDVLGMDVKQNAQLYSDALSEAQAWGGETRNIFGKYKSLEELRNTYYDEFGTYASEDLTQEQLAAAIETKIVQKTLSDAITNMASQLDASAVKEYSQYTILSAEGLRSLTERTAGIEIRDEEGNIIRPYESLNRLALSKQIESYENLASALYQNTLLQGLNFESASRDLQEKLNLSIDQTNNLANYVNTFGTNFGQATGQAVYDALTSNGEAWNTQFYEQLQNVSTTNSLTSLASLERQIGIAGSPELAESMRGLQQAMIRDINDRGGLAKALFTSSDFQDVFSQLQDTFKSTGTITAENVSKLAAKNETLSAYLETTRGNTQAVADMASMLSTGQITADDLTPAVAAFVNEASSGHGGAQQRGLDTLNNQDLSTSYSEIDQYYQNGGKAWYTAVQNDMLNDAPLKEFLASVLTPEDYAEYEQILYEGIAHDTDWMVEQMSVRMKDAYDMLQTLQGTGKRKGKGGGGLDTALAYLGKQDILAGAGITFDEKTGDYTFAKDFGELFAEATGGGLQTEGNMYKYIFDYLTSEDRGDQKMSRQQAQVYASQIVGRMSSESTGQAFAINGAIAGAEAMSAEIKEGKNKTVSGDALDALYEQYKGTLGLMKIENGQLVAASKEDLANTDFKGITEDEFKTYIAGQVSGAGGAIVDTFNFGIGGQGTSLTDLGNILQENGYGTISQGGARGVLEAALKTGVGTYTQRQGVGYASPWEATGTFLDFQDLKDFYINTLGLSEDMFQAHMPDLLQAASETFEGQNTGLNYQYKDIFGNTHNISSTESRFKKEDGTFDYKAYSDAIAESEEENALDTYEQQRLMEEAYDEAQANKKAGEGETDWRAIYDQKVAERNAERAAKEDTGVTYGKNEENPDVNAITGDQQREANAAKINKLKEEYGLSEDEILRRSDDGESFDDMIAAEETARKAAAAKTAADAANARGAAYTKQIQDEEAARAAKAAADAANARGAAYTKQIQDEEAARKAAHDAEVEARNQGREQERQAALELQHKQEQAALDEELANIDSLDDLEDFIDTHEVNAELEAHINARRQELIHPTEPEPEPEPEPQPITTTATYVQEAQDRAAEEEAARKAAEKAAHDAEVEARNQGREQERQAALELQDKQEQAALDEELANIDSLDDLEDFIDTHEVNAELEARINARRQELIHPTEPEPITTAEEGEETPPAKEEKTEDTREMAMEAADAYLNDAASRGQLNNLVGLSDEAVTNILSQSGLTPEAQQEALANIQEMREDQAAEEAAIAATTAVETTLETPTEEGGGSFWSKLVQFGEDHAPTDEELYGTGLDVNSPEVPATDPNLAKIGKDVTAIAANTGETAEATSEFNTTLNDSLEGGYNPLTGEATGEVAFTDAEGNEYDANGNKIGFKTKQTSSGSGTSGTTTDSNGYTVPTKTPVSSNPVERLKETLKTGGSLPPAGSTYTDDNGYTIPITQEDIDQAVNETTAESQMQVPGMSGYDASGQNNARILGYASGKDYPHIAVTGELGPELRVKEDGSMDLLGQKGREYTWVEPGDRIYTAAQTASILGNNNSIPQLEALAKGINNFIPGYGGSSGVDLSGTSGDKGGSSGSSSGSSSSSSSSSSGDEGTDPRYDPYTLKIRDYVTRYYTITEQLADIAAAVDRFAKVADRAWGEDKINALEKQTDLYRKQLAAQEKYVAEIEKTTQEDKKALTTAVRDFVQEYNDSVDDDSKKLSLEGAEFDENGVMTNYEEYVTKLLEQYNENAEDNSDDDAVKTKLQERINDIQYYTDSLNLLQEQKDLLQEYKNLVLDSALKEITYRIEYENELDANELKLIDFELDKVKDNAYRAAEAIDYYAQKIDFAEKSNKRYEEGIKDILATYANGDLMTKRGYDITDMIKINKNGNITNEKEISDQVEKWYKQLKKVDKEAAASITIKRNKDGLITNYREVVEEINKANSKLTDEMYDLLLNDTDKFFKKWADYSKNANFQDLTTETVSNLESMISSILDNLTNESDMVNKMLSYIGDSIKTFAKDIKAEVDEFDYYDQVLGSYQNIIDLTNRRSTDITTEFIQSMDSAILDNAINKLKSTKKVYESMQRDQVEAEKIYKQRQAIADAFVGDEKSKKDLQDLADEAKRQLDTVNAQVKSAHEDYLKSWEDAMSKTTDIYQKAVEEAARTFEESFSPYFTTMELLQAEFDRQKALDDQYVDDYQRIHDLSKLNRDLEKSILDTDNLKSKEKLRDLQKEINDLQKSGAKLSEYDLNILDKKYKVELARQALEDAKDAKSIVRLSRDNNGNWGYVYTSNEEDVDQAEQNYEDAIREMEQANEDYINNLQDQILQIRQDALSQIQALNPADFADADALQAAINSIWDSANQSAAFIQQQLNNAFKNNDYLDPHIVNIYGDNLHDLSNNWNDLTLAVVSGIDSMDTLTNNLSNDIQQIGKAAMEAFTTFSERQAEVYKEAGANIENASEFFTEEITAISDLSDDQVDKVTEVTDKAEQAFKDITDALEKHNREIQDSIDYYTKLTRVLTDFIALSGKFETYQSQDANLDFIGENDTPEEVQEILNKLKEHGEVLITRKNEKGDYTSEIVKEGTKAAKELIADTWENFYKSQAFSADETWDDLDIEKINEFLDKYGLVYIKKTQDDGTVKLTKYLKSSSEDMAALKTLMEENKEEDSSSDGNNSSDDGEWWWHQRGSGTKDDPWKHGYDTGGYTGEWANGSIRTNGRLAMLHQKELVLNEHDTENFLNAMEIVRQLDNLSNWMSNGLGDVVSPTINASGMGELEQNVHIDASFPNVQDHNEIEQAFNNLVNLASQYANRKTG